MVSACPSSFTPSRINPSLVAAPSPKTAWQHAVAQADLPFHTKGILLIVAIEWMDADGGSCFPTEEQIMERTGVSRPCLTRHMRIAVKDGFIERWRWGHGNGNRRYNYRAVIPGVPAPEVEMGNDVSYQPGGMGNEVSDHEPCPSSNHFQTPESAAPEPAPPEPAAPAPEPAPPLSNRGRKKPTPPPDTMPDSWIDAAIEMRPDLTAEQISRSAARFLDYQRGKGNEYRDWLPIWRIWISKERIDSPKTAGQRPQATPSDRRYPRPDQTEQPVSEAVKAALELGEQRRVDQLMAAGIDPATGLRLTPATPEPEPAPTPYRPPVVGIKPIQEPELTAEEQQRQRQIADLAAQGLTLADARAARNPVRLAPTPPTPARRYTAEQQRRFIQLAAQGLTPAQIRERLRLD